MQNEPRVYRHPPYQIVLVILIFGVMIVGILFSFSLDMQTLPFLLPFAFLIFLLALYSLYAMSSKTIISDTEISVQNILGSKSLGWNEIRRVSGRYHGIRLHNFDGDVTVSPSPQLPGYEEIIEWIGTKRPDLFTAEEGQEMNRSWFIVIITALIVILVVGVATLSIIQTEQWFLSIFFAFVGAMVLIIVAAAPQSVTFEGRSLLIKYILGQKTLRADEIEFIQLVSQRTRNGKTYHIQLHLPGGKNVRITNLGPSLPIVYLTLKTWHRKHTGNDLPTSRTFFA